MKKLIEALQIFAKYRDLSYPTICEHDILFIVEIERDEISEEDKCKLEELGFDWSNEYDCWVSTKYGSA